MTDSELNIRLNVIESRIDKILEILEREVLKKREALLDPHLKAKAEFLEDYEAIRQYYTKT